MLKDLLEGKPLRHPLHPILVHFPIGFFILSLLLDLTTFIFPSVSLVRGSFYAILFGTVTSLVAAVPGFVDYTDIRIDHPAKRTATAHMILNLIVVVTYGINLAVRNLLLLDSKVSTLPLTLSCIAVGLLSVSGYLGGRLVYDQGIAVGRHKRKTPTPRTTLHLSTTNAVRQGEVAFVLVPNAERLRDGETLRVGIDGEVMAIARIGSSFYAFQEFCTHRFGPLSEGCIGDFNIQCPWHNSRFDVRTGKVSQGPAKIDLKTFRVDVREGNVYVGITHPVEPVKPVRSAA